MQDDEHKQTPWVGWPQLTAKKGRDAEKRKRVKDLKNEKSE